MKKTLFLLMALGSLAWGADTQMLDLSTTITAGSLTYDTETHLITGSETADLYESPNNKAQTNVILTLNLTAASAATANTKIIELDYNGTAQVDVGLLATSEGLVGSWNGNPNGNNTYSWTDLRGNSSVFTGNDGNQYITLMLSQWNNGGPNFRLNSGNNNILITTGLGSSSINTLSAIFVDNDYVAAVKVTPAWINTEELRQQATAEFDAIVKENLTRVTEYYWEAEGNGNWSDAKWSAKDDDTSDLTTLPATGTANVIFNNAETATVSIDAMARATSVRVDAGTYTFDGSDASLLWLSGDFSVAKSATANVNTGLMAGNILAEGTLNIKGNVAAGRLTVDTDGVLSIDGSLSTGTLTVNANGVLKLNNTTLNSTWNVTNSGTIELGGAINLEGFTGVTGDSLAPSVNGFGSVATSYVIFTTGSSSAANVTAWQIDGKNVEGTAAFDKGTLTVTTPDTIYYITTGSVAYDAAAPEFAGATRLVLNGGTLRPATDAIADGFIDSTDKGGTIDLSGVEFSQSKLGNLAGAVQLSSNADGIYHLGADTALKAGVSLADSWGGTVNMGDVDDMNMALDISELGKAGSKIKLGFMNLKSLTSSTSASVSADSLYIEEDSRVAGDLSVNYSLTLGNADKAAHLRVDGNLTVDTIVLGNADSGLSARSLQVTGDIITVAVANPGALNELNAAAAQGGVTLISLSDSYAGTEAVLDTSAAISRAVADSQVQKYFSVMEWDAAKKNLMYRAAVNEKYVSELLRAQSHNGLAGQNLLQNTFLKQNPQVSNPDGDLAKVMDALDAGYMSDRAAAAVAGSSTASLGLALAGDVERQLRAIRNRTTTMGVNQCVINEGMPYVNAWVNAEGNLGELNADGTCPGYSLESWCGTVGFDVDANPYLTLGLAVTAMYGDFTVDAPDVLDGDLDTCYVSAFVRYARSAWTHTLIGTVGTMNATYERTVNYGNGSYKSKGDTDGSAFGLMYELGKVFALDDEGDTCLQPIFNVAYRHSSVGGYREDGKDAALKVDDQTLNTVTVGLGARLQSIVGENLYNRTSVLELRALAKLDAGDRNSEASVAFIGSGLAVTVESAEYGAFGVELGAGLSIPLGDENSGNIFFDVSADLRSGYSQVNGTVGYRINF